MNILGLLIILQIILGIFTVINGAQIYIAALHQLSSIFLVFSSKISAEVIDLRIISPLKINPIIQSVMKTSNLVVIDGGTRTCGYASEVITSVVEVNKINLN